MKETASIHNKNLRDWIKQYNPLFDCTYVIKNEDSTSMSRFLNEELEYFRNHKNKNCIPPEMFGRKYPIYRRSFFPNLHQFKEHSILKGDKTIFTSNAKSSKLLMLVDIDNKQGKGNSCEAADYLSKKYLNNSTYIEDSTSGKGKHIYFIMDCYNLKSWPLFYKRISEFLEMMKEDEFFDSTGCNVDKIMGLPTYWSFDNSKDEGYKWKIEKRGNLLRIPFCQTEEDLNKIKNIKPLPFLALDYHFKKKEIQVLLDRNEKENNENKKIYADAMKRMHFACSSFYKEYKRFPENPLELVFFYESNDLHTGPDINNRRFFRASDVLNYHIKNFDSSKVKREFEQEKYVKIVKENITEDMIKQIKCDREITYLDLAIGLYAFEISIFSGKVKDSWKFTVGMKSIQEMFKIMKEEKKLKVSCNSNKSVAIRKILTISDLISVINDNWIHSGKKDGICKKFGLGPKHPEYKMFLEFYNKNKVETLITKSVITINQLQNT